jgi:protein disulfide-isomerase-like protein
MKVIVLLLAALALVAAEGEGASDVVVLTKDNFDTQTASGNWLLEFYAPWCGHCKRLEPIYNEVATKLKGQVNVGKVDCTVHQDVCGRFGVRGYPTVRGLFGGKLYEYKRARTVEDFLKFAEGEYSLAPNVPLPDANAAPAAPAAPAAAEPAKPAAPASAPSTGSSDVVILSDANFKSSISAGGVWLIKFYAPWCGHCKKMAPTYEQVATNLKGKVNVAKVDCTVNSDVCERFGVRGYPTIKLIDGDKVYEYRKSRTLEDFVSYASGDYKAGESSPLPAGAKQ